MRWLLGVVLLLSLAACGREADIAVRDEPSAVQGDDAAIAACVSRAEYQDTTLRAAFDTTVGELKAWLDSRQPPDWGHVELDYERNRTDAAAISLCWVDDGSLAFPSGPTAVGGRPRAALVIDAADHVFFLFGGYFERPDRADLEIVRPTSVGSV